MSATWVALAAAAAGGGVLLWPGPPRRAADRAPPQLQGRASPRPAGPVPVAVVIELIAAAMRCGLPPVDAVAAAISASGAHDLQPVVDALRLGAGAEASWCRSGPAYTSLARTMVLADRTGAAAALALSRAAIDERAARRRRAQVAARRLGVRLVLPLGLLTLPSFVLLGVVPVVLGLAAEFLSG